MLLMGLSPKEYLQQTDLLRGVDAVATCTLVCEHGRSAAPMEGRSTMGCHVILNVGFICSAVHQVTRRALRLSANVISQKGEVMQLIGVG